MPSTAAVKELPAHKPLPVPNADFYNIVETLRPDEQAILKTPNEEDLMLATEDTHGRPDPAAAVKLLRMDDDKGWLLE